MKRVDVADDRGSTIPLILGFFLLAFLVVAGSVMASDAFTKQRDLQSICDGSAVAASNAVSGPAARTVALGAALPLQFVQVAVDTYLARDPGRAGVSVRASLSADGATVLADCRVRSRIAFGAVIARGSGIELHATARARGLLRE